MPRRVTIPATRMVPKTHRMRLTRTGWGVAATGKEKAQLRQVGAETAQTEAHCGQHLVTTLPDIRLKLAQAWVVQEKEKTEKTTLVTGVTRPLRSTTSSQ